MYKSGMRHTLYVILKKGSAFIAALAILIIATGSVSAAGQQDSSSTNDSTSQTDDIFQQQMYDSNTDQIGNIINKYIDNESSSIYGSMNIGNIIGDIISGKLELKPATIIKAIPGYLFHEMTANISILFKLVVIAIICSLLKNLQTSFLRQEVGEIAFFVCYAVFAAMAALSFKTASDLGLKTIDDMVGFMYASVPVLSSLIVSSGSVISGSAFQPLMLMAAEFTASAIRNIFVPAVFLSTILYLINNLSERIQITKLAGIIKKTTIISLGFIVTAFLAAFSVQGVLKGVADGVAGKTIKFAISTFIPVIGGYLSDAAGAVVSCTLLIRNAAGIAVMIGLILLCTVPLLKLLTVILLYRFSALLVEPLSEKRIINCFGDIADAMTVILGMVAAVAVMFIIAVSTAIGSVNTAAMMR